MLWQNEGFTRVTNALDLEKSEMSTKREKEVSVGHSVPNCNYVETQFMVHTLSSKKTASKDMLPVLV